MFYISVGTKSTYDFPNSFYYTGICSKHIVVDHTLANVHCSLL